MSSVPPGSQREAAILRLKALKAANKPPSKLSLLAYHTFVSFIQALWHTISLLWCYTGSRWVYIKDATNRLPQAEVSAMKLVRSCTTVPVPRVWFTIYYRHRAWIFMSRLHGQALTGHTWNELDDRTRKSLVAQLKDHLGQIRSLPSPDASLVSSACGGPVLDHCLCRDVPHGPYANESVMNCQLRAGRPLENLAAIDALVYKSHSTRHPIVFTHGDISPRNLMISGDKVTGWLDWESAGWYPAHWEYVKAHWSSWFPDEALWRDDLASWIPPFEEEKQATSKLGHLWPRAPIPL